MHSGSFGIFAPQALTLIRLSSHFHSFALKKAKAKQNAWK
jgi:hypothetical protein